MHYTVRNSDARAWDLCAGLTRHLSSPRYPLIHDNRPKGVEIQPKPAVHTCGRLLANPDDEVGVALVGGYGFTDRVGADGFNTYLSGGIAF